MSMTDPIADMLTRIRNATLVGHDTVVIPRSRLKLEILRILQDEGFVSNVENLGEDASSKVRVHLKYDTSRQSIIQGLRRISTPGRRLYVGKEEIPHVRNGLGVAILTTPRGVLTDKAARHAGVGGEVICYVW